MSFLQLSDKAQERAVPSTRVGRLASFGSLGLGLGMGTMAEASRRMFGMSDGNKV